MHAGRVTMAERRMFSKTITNTARFLMMPSSARLLYYDLGMAADDDGIVEAFVVMRLSGAKRSDLDTLEKKGYVKILSDELVTHILDWRKNNQIKNDRYQPSVYKELLGETAEQSPENQAKSEWIQSGTEPEPNRNPSGTEPEPQDRLGKDRLGKDRLGEDRLGEGRENGTRPLPESEKELLVSEGISESYIEEREHRANDYARTHQRSVSSVLREWWAKDRQTYAEPSAGSFDTDEFFEAALANTMKKMQELCCETG